MLRLTLPPRTTEVLGEEAAAELAEWAADTFALRDDYVYREEYRQIVSRLDILEHDVSGLRADVTELRRTLDARLDAVNARFDGMEERFDARFDRLQSEVNARFDRMQSEVNARFDVANARIDTIHDVVRSQTRWLVGTLIALGGMISVLITIFEFIR